MTDQKQLPADDTLALSEGADTPVLESGDDLAAQALASADGGSVGRVTGAKGAALDEVAASNELAETLGSLQNVIERHANELQRIAEELKQNRELMNNFFENDTTLQAAQEEAKMASASLKERRGQVANHPQVTSLRVKLTELGEQKKEIEETLSHHLVNYYQLTNSKSFDTSDGDQWEFSVNARVKPRKKKSDD